MKNIWKTLVANCLTILAVIITTQSFAQSTKHYTFAADTNTTYMPLTGATSVNSGVGINNQTYAITLPFTFYFNNNVHNSGFISSNGFITLGPNAPTATTNVFAAVLPDDMISPMGADLKATNATADISYKTLGTAPNRKFVVQWSNLTVNSTNTSNLNFQLELAEADSSIHFKYGTCTANNTLGFSVGIRGWNTADLHCRQVSANWMNSIKALYNAGASFTSANYPSNKLHYQFNPPPLCTLPSAPSNLLVNMNGNYLIGTFTAPNTTADKYLLVSSNGAFTGIPYNTSYYWPNFTLGNGTVIDTISTNSFSTYYSAQPTSTYTLTIIPYNDSCYGNPTYNTSAAISIAIYPTGKKYVWQPTSGTGNYKDPTNWLPVRNCIHRTDSLYFTNGGNSIIKNPAFYLYNGISSVVVGNNTIANFVTDTTIAYGMYIENSLDIQANSTMTVKGTQNYFPAFDCYASIPSIGTKINGTLILDSNVTFNNNGTANTIVNGTVIVKNNCALTGGAATKFTNGSNYIHNKNGGYIPTANFDTNSNITINNITTTMPYNPNSKLGNLLWDCPLQTVDNYFNNMDTILGNCKIVNTNTGAVGFAVNGSVILGTLEQTGGNIKTFHNAGARLQLFGNALLTDGSLFVNVNNHIAYGNIVFYKNITQGANHNMYSNSNTATNSASILFAGKTSQQIDFLGTTANYKGNYILANSNGVVLGDSLIINQQAKHIIELGNYTGVGNIYYNQVVSSLVFNNSFPISTTNKEFPSTDGPTTIELNCKGVPATNLVYLHEPRTLNNTLILNNGVLVLNQNSLYVKNYMSPLATYNENKMVVADSTGFLYQQAGNNYPGGEIYPIGDRKNGFTYSPVTIPNSTPLRRVGVRVIPNAHPNNPNNTQYVTRYFEINEDSSLLGTSWNYQLLFSLPMQDVVGLNSVELYKYNNNTWQNMSSYTAQNANLLNCNTSTNLISPTDTISGVYAFLASSYNVYTWNGFVNKNFKEANNWTPARTTPKSTDILQFNNGINDTVDNVSTQAIAQLFITNNTTVVYNTFEINLNNIIYITGDNDTSTVDFLITQGSKLYLAPAVNEQKVIAGGTNILCKPKVLIDGNIYTFNGPSLLSTSLNFTNFSGTIGSTAQLFISQKTCANGGYPLLFSNNDNVKMLGKLTMSYSAANANITEWPAFNWQPGSVLNVVGITNGNNANYVKEYTKKLYNLTFNCPSLSVPYRMANLPTVLDTFQLISTGSSQIDILNFVIPCKYYVNNFIQTGGTINSAPPTLGYLPTIVFGKSLWQTGGVIKNTGSLHLVLEFKDSTSATAVNFNNAPPVGKIQYNFSNNNGVNMSGTGALASTFTIGATNIVQVNTTANPPITTLQNIVYSTNTWLKYTVDSDAVIPAALFPAVNGPRSVQVYSNANAFATVHMPFARTITDTLHMIRGFLNTHGSNITVGTSAIQSGFIIANASSGVILDTGTITKYVKTINYSSAGRIIFPIFSKLFKNRTLTLYGNSSTTNSIATGGFIKVKYADTNGINYTPYFNTNAGYIVNRTNSFWKIDTSVGLALIPNATIRLECGIQDICTPMSTYLYLIDSASAFVAVQQASGTAQNMVANASNITFANTATHNVYIGSTNAMLDNNVFTIASGNWNNPAIWNINAVPGPAHQVQISTGTNVIVNDKQAVYQMTVQQNASVTLQADTLFVEQLIENFGTIVLNNAALKLYYTGGGNRKFTNYNTFEMNGGYMELNGGMTNSYFSSFTQNAGHILINPLGVDAQTSASVGMGFYSNKLKLQSGLLQFFNPTFNVNTLDVNMPGKVKCGTNYTVMCGGNTDLIPYAYVNNYYYSLHINQNYGTSQLAFSHIVVDVNNSVYPLVGVSTAGVIVKGNISVLNKGRLFIGTNKTIVGGNIYIDSSAILYTDNNITFATIDSNFNEVTNTQAQTITGIGTMRNYYNGYTFDTVRINNSNAAGVKIFNKNIGITNKIEFVKGILHNVDGYTSISNFPSNYPASTNSGWLVGDVKYVVLNTFMQNTTVALPTGNLQYYLPIHLFSSYTSKPFGGTLLAELISTDHPAISSSNILSNKSINHHWKLTPSANFSMGGHTITTNFTWHASMQDAGINLQNLSASKYKNLLNNNTWTNNVPTSFATNNASVISDIDSIAGQYQIGEIGNVVSITKQPSPDTICQNTSTTFVVNALSGSTYQWQLYAGGIWGNLSNAGNYAGVTTNSLAVLNAPVAFNANFYRCAVTLAGNTSNTIPVYLLVNPTVTPVVSLVSLTPNPICANDTSILTANYTNAGTAPTFSWTLNGALQTASSQTISIPAPTTSYTIVVSAHSSASCLYNNVFQKDTIIITKQNTVVPTASTTLLTPSSACYNTIVQASATSTNTGIAPSYQWTVNGNAVGNLDSLLTLQSGASTFTINCIVTASSDACVNPNFALTNSIIVTVVNPIKPQVNIIANPLISTNLCPGTSFTFTPIPLNAGANPIYNWYKNGTVISTANTYITNSLLATDSVWCVVQPSYICGVTDSGISSKIGVPFLANTNYNVSIAATPNDTICAGTMVNFTASITGTTFQTYNWYKNNFIALGSSATLNVSNLVNNDSVFLVITPAGIVCPITPKDTSVGIRFKVNANTPPAVTIAAIGSTTICATDTAKLKATIGNTNYTNTYQWYKNNIAIAGATDSIYKQTNTVTADVFKCVIHTQNPCAVPDSAVSGNITYTVNPTVVPSITLNTPNGTNVCAGSNYTFTSTTTTTNGGTAPQYQWYVNNVAANTTSVLNSNALQNNDVLYCVLTSNANCRSKNVDTSASITVTVNAVVVPTNTITVAPNNIYVAGTTYTFTASVTNQGATPSYKWFVNNVLQAGNSDVFTSNSLQWLDVVDCQMTSSELCPVPIVVASNAIKLVAPDAIATATKQPVFSIYPNPTKQFVYIKGNTNNTVVQLEVRTVQGHLVLVKTITNTQNKLDTKLDLQSLANGVYMLKIISNNNTSIYKLELMRD